MRKTRARTRFAAMCLMGLCLVSVGTASAATRYVSDQLSINMRSGPGNQYRIDRLLDAGDQLETLSSNNGWTKVRTRDGKVGFVLTRFLADSPAAESQLADAKNKADNLSSENQDLKKELSEALHGSDQLGELKKNLVAENKSLKAQLQKIRETSADAIRIGNENEKYRQQIMQLRSTVDRLKHENESLQSRREGMQVGALILTGGILIGLFLPMLRRRRKGNWDSL
ncbi:TIGR04211 family SH3 domain-containing protein [Salinisphaera sp. Q1T1-3]|uniref:TIGR04211 family SH3 domain-containing protein n=1 Tax=Salinisphaera sp. Q1T1-3 TaxID=2321229 RepID=UPI000E7108DD|nr:TIGR04211 family SH3 domain-containing protein [Salinisphaera sp. Q1T1-3]RJS94663.1 TIGR04211 family SH3 domain-containing protein [Salinisphaera sp. Q1T1-3]